MLHRSLLRSSSDLATRALLLDAVERLRWARGVWTERDADADAVHDLRVALTRLRALAALWPSVADELLGVAAPRSLRRAHRALAPLRTDDVRRVHLAAYRTRAEDDGTESPNVATRALLERLTRRRSRRAARAERVLARELDPLLAGIAPEPLEPDVSPLDEPVVTANAFARELERAVHTAAHAVLDSALDARSPEARHHTRLALKRLRALVIPWIDAEPALGPLLRIATAGQDAFGDERDLEQLRDFVSRATRRLTRDARRAKRRQRHRLAADARALRLALRERQHTLAQHLVDEWLLPHAPARSTLHLTLATASAALRAARPATVVECPDEPVVERHAPSSEVVAPAAPAADTSPPALPVEIERKFLLSALPDHVRALEGIRIAQGWLPGERLRERLRRSVFPGGRVEWTRTVKLGTGISRIEVEEATDPILFESLWPFTAAARIEKIRYVVEDGSLTWEIDRFLDRELVLAEVELPSTDHVVTPPLWLSPYIVRDVTDDADYVNANLARRRPSLARA